MPEEAVKLCIAQTRGSAAEKLLVWEAQEAQGAAAMGTGGSPVSD